MGRRERQEKVGWAACEKELNLREGVDNSRLSFCGGKPRGGEDSQYSTWKLCHAIMGRVFVPSN